MSKKKVSGRHVAIRKTIQIPQDWVAMARELAAEVKMPVAWLVIELLRKEAEAKGKKNLPSLPWDASPPPAST